MRALVSISILCLLLPQAAAAASRQGKPAPSARTNAVRYTTSDASADWLTQHLHRPIAVSQILTSPETSSLRGCVIAHIRLAPTGATAVSLRCPGQSLPQMILLNLSCASAPHPSGSPLISGGPQPPSFGDCGEHNLPTHHPSPSRKFSAALPPLVRPGAALQADWRTPSLHAELPVVALDPGSIGSEIRVRVARTDRVFRAHILTASTVTIVEAGV